MDGIREPIAGRILTLENLCHGELVDLLELEVLEEESVHVEESTEGGPTRRKLEPLDKLPLQDLLLEPLQLLDSLDARPRAVVALARREEDSRIEVQLKDFSPPGQVILGSPSVGWFRYLCDFVSYDGDFLSHLSLFFLLKVV